MKTIVCCLIGLVALFSGSAGYADESADAASAEKNLAEIRERIEKLEKEARRAAKRRGSAEQALQKAEISEAKVHRELQRVDADLAGARNRLAELRDQSTQTRSELTGHRTGLERQLRLAYVTGREDWLRTVLSRQDPHTIGRQLVYYQYLARQRSGLIDAVRSQLQALEENANAADREKNRLEEIQTVQQERLQELAAARKSRRVALAKIDKKIESSSGQLDRLRTEAEDLETLVTELTRLLAGMPVGDSTPFRDTRGRLDWPTQGRLVRKFGQPKADGRLRWKGVLLAAGAGSDVRAVHHGRVIFSDWLPGMGLLVIVEHGDGYLSLYGHNQDLMSDVGEWVTPATVIAHVGDSGGQASPGLYFEIRKDGRPVNPGDWVRR